MADGMESAMSDEKKAKILESFRQIDERIAAKDRLSADAKSKADERRREINDYIDAVVTPAFENFKAIATECGATVKIVHGPVLTGEKEANSTVRADRSIHIVLDYHGREAAMTVLATPRHVNVRTKPEPVVGQVARAPAQIGTNTTMAQFRGRAIDEKLQEMLDLLAGQP